MSTTEQIVSVPRYRDDTGRFSDHLLITTDGARVGGSYWACGDGITPGQRWRSWGPAGLRTGFRTRREAEAVQVIAYRPGVDTLPNIR